MKKKSNNRLFWILQIFGWTVYALLMFFLFSKSKPDDYLSKALFLYSYVLGFLFTSFILRYLYRYYRKKIKLVKWLLTFIILTILIIVPLWYFTDVITSMIFWEESKITDYSKYFSLMFYFRRNFEVYILFFAWI